MPPLSPTPPLSWPKPAVTKCESYLALLRKVQPLSQALSEAVRTNNALMARQVNEQIDALQVSIFRALRRRTAQEAFSEPSASVAELAAVCAPGRPEVSLATTLLTIIVSQQVQYFNVGKTMNAAQVAMTVDDVIDRFGYMTLEEIATTFAIARRTAKVYDRLDPNILLSWLYDYDSRRDELCERVATSQMSTATVPVASASGMSFSEYTRWLETEAAKGNPDAIRDKEIFEANKRRAEEPDRKEAAFQAWRKEMGV